MSVNALIVGHSQTKYFSQYIADKAVTILPFPGYQFNQLWNEIKDHVPHFQIIAIHCGVNDLSRNEADEAAKRLRILLHDIWQVNPWAEIILSSVLPRSQNLFPGQQRSSSFLSHVNRRIICFNYKLMDICNSHPQLHLITHPNFVKKGMLSKDGLHLSRAGTTELVKDIMEGINFVRRLSYSW